MSVPRGFFQSDGGFSCDDVSGAFVRGILVETPKYNALSFDDKFELQQTHVYPRWRLYGGPFYLKMSAQKWDEYLFFWGFEHGITWVSHGTVCVVPDWAIPWPADKSVQWTWVHEASAPAQVRRQYSQPKNAYENVWVPQAELLSGLERAWAERPGQVVRGVT